MTEGIVVGVVVGVVGTVAAYFIIRAIEWPGRAKRRSREAAAESAAQERRENQALREFLAPLRAAWTFVAWIEEISRDPQGSRMGPTGFTTHLRTMANDLDSVWNRVAEQVTSPAVKDVFPSAARFDAAVRTWERYHDVKQAPHDMAWHRVALQMMLALNPVKDAIGTRLEEVKSWTPKPYGH